MSTSDEDENEYMLYKNRPEWNDVVPIPQCDGPYPVVQIAYSDKFKDVFDYFRAVIKENEMSDRALSLTKDAIEQNPANYTVWQYRRVLLKFLKKDIEQEMKFLSKIISEQPKNYQVWHHRKALVEWSKDSSQELDFTFDMLSLDNKNYHAWQHRQWVIKEFCLWKGELEVVDKFLELDVRNNSAWNQRYFVISHTSGYTDEVITAEIQYTIKKIDEALRNESAWNYLRGILLEKGFNWSKVLVNQVHLWRSEKELDSPYLAAFLLEIYSEDMNDPSKDHKEIYAKIKKIIEELTEVTDRIRSRYWKFYLKRIENENSKKIW